MRRVRVLLLTGVCVIGVSANADAWWGWIDELSGPKGFKGMQFDVRVKCLGVPANQSARDLLEFVKGLKQSDLATTSASVLSLASRFRADSLSPLAAAAKRAQRVTSDETVQDIERRAGTYITRQAALDLLGGTDAELLSDVVSIGFLMSSVDLAAVHIDSADSTPASGEKDVRDLQGQIGSFITALAEFGVRRRVVLPALTTLPFLGLRLSLCDQRDDDERRFSVGALTRVYFASDHSSDVAPPGDPRNFEDFASGHMMYMFTVGPTVEWRPLYFYKSRCPEVDCQRAWGADWVDLGASAGYYHIGSAGFAPMNGTVVSAYANLHVPAHLVRKHPWTRAIPVLRIGRTGFVGGFKANAFGPKLTGPKAAQIDGPYDWTWERSLFVDLGSIF